MHSIFRKDIGLGFMRFMELQVIDKVQEEAYRQRAQGEKRESRFNFWSIKYEPDGLVLSRKIKVLPMVEVGALREAEAPMVEEEVCVLLLLTMLIAKASTSFHLSKSALCIHGIS